METALVLLEAGADPLIASADGRMALHEALLHGHYSLGTVVNSRIRCSMLNQSSVLHAYFIGAPC